MSGFLETNGQVGSMDFGRVIGDELMKALTLGTGTDSANMTGGRALVPQDIDQTVLNALAAKRRDFKLMNLLKTRKAGSSVVEYTRRSDAGQYGLIFGKEGGEARSTDQALERVTRMVKYMQTYREITLQMRTANTLEDAEASEKEAGILTILKGAEHGCFHGNADAVPEQFDNVIKQILSVNGPNGFQNVYDARGKALTNVGEKAFKEVARMTFENGGSLSHAFMPSLLASDMQDVVKDRLRLNVGDTKGTGVIEKYPTPFSDEIIIAGEQGGPDKMFFCRGPVAALGVAADRPNAPAIAAVTAPDALSQYVAADQGNYTYAVHAIDENGISAASDPVTVAVAAGDGVTITITHDAAKPGTGFIITRGKKGVATDLREIARVGIAAGPITRFVDNNLVLPGTGDILLLSHDSMAPTVRWDQFLPAMKFDLYPTRSAIIPFLIVMFGTPDVTVPWFNGVIRNVSPADLGWF
jgi:hypothetical protein